ncbi:hypothetical protein T09_8984 [Trichinella sp. T9]|nr:hypothetical protein T09_8984 [Trichinella sp. T9]
MRLFSHNSNYNSETYKFNNSSDFIWHQKGFHLQNMNRTAKQAIYLFHKILAILETSGSPTFLGCDPLSKTSQLYCILRSKLNLNEESSDKSINSQSAFVDMPVRTTSACCEKLDRNSDSQVISN